MAFLALIIAVVLIVSAIRGTHGDLLGALAADVPEYVVWGAAILGVAVLGFIPGLKPISRGLLALVVVVLILTNYKAIIEGFQNAWQGAPQQASGGSGGSGGPVDFMSQLADFGKSAGLDYSDLLGRDTSGPQTGASV